MGHRFAPDGLRVLVLHNDDYRLSDADAHDFASRADVENAARGIAAALTERGHRADLRAVDRDSLFAVVSDIAADPPDLVFNLCESLAGESEHEPVLPSLLDLFRVPYTGSGPAALGLALRKERAKDILQARGVPTPPSVLVEDPAAIADIALPFPLIVKPAHEDASVGIHAASVCRDAAALAAACERVTSDLGQPALVERFIEGREIYVSLLGNAPPAALPFHEIDFSDLPPGLPHIVSYSAKWDAASPEFHGTRPVRCHLDDNTRRAVEQAARAAFAALDLRDYARVDVRLAADGTPHVIDVNPNCDLSDGAGFSRAAGFAGLDYPTLVERVCLAAWERTQHAQQLPRAAVAALVPTIADDARPPAAARRSPGALDADRRGRSVHLGRGEVRARADRRRAR